MSSTRKRWTLLLSFGLFLLYAIASQPQPPTGPLIHQDLQDLYWIFQHEARIESSRNAYKTLGNHLQLEGKVYSNLLKALNAYDLTGLIQTAVPAGSERQTETAQALARSREAFEAALAELPWPQWSARLHENQIEFDTASPLTLYRGGVPNGSCSESKTSPRNAAPWS